MSQSRPCNLCCVPRAVPAHFLSRHFIPFAGWFTAPAPHDLVEGLEVRSRFPIFKKLGNA
jgi:hypothetical protein